MKIHKFYDNYKNPDEYQKSNIRKIQPEFEEFSKNLINQFSLHEGPYINHDCYFFNKKVIINIYYYSVSIEEIERFNTLMKYINSFNNNIYYVIGPKTDKTIELYIMIDIMNYIKISDDIETRLMSKKYNL
jgi:hypothetical protein